MAQRRSHVRKAIDEKNKKVTIKMDKCVCIAALAAADARAELL